MGPPDLSRDPIRAVLDTNVLLSALLFANGRLSWLRPCWQRDALIPVVAEPTVRELLREPRKIKNLTSTDAYKKTPRGAKGSNKLYIKMTELTQAASY